MAKLGDLKALLEARRAKDESARATPARARAASASPVRGSNATTAKRALAASKHADGDIDLESAFRDVRRLPTANRARISAPPPPPIPKQRLADEEEALLASKYGSEAIEHSWEVGQEHEGEQTFLRPGLGTDILAKLRRGHWSLQGEIDLHGSTSDEARDRVAEFLLDARARGERCVRIIHGTGLTSPGKEPVLKGKVRRWLAQWDDVLAYCEAPRHAGGAGAVLVLLRGR